MAFKRRDEKQPDSDDLLNQWQIAEIRKGLEEADRGEFVSEEELHAALAKWLQH